MGNSYSIGGEMGIPAAAFLEEKYGDLPNPYEKTNSVYVDTGRSALYGALCSIIAVSGKREAWLPYYCCSAVINPFIRLGFHLHYYSMGRNLKKPRFPEQQAITGGVFLFINYFGRRNQPVIDWLTSIERNFFIIEDNVQASLNSGPCYGDFIINSYRKFLPQPDGALLASNWPLRLSLLPPCEDYLSRVLIGKVLRQNAGDSEVFLQLFAEAESSLDQCHEPRSLSFLSRFMMERTDIAAAASRRIQHYDYLFELLQGDPLLSSSYRPLFNVLEPGEVPLGLPITVLPARRERLREYLKEQGIYCPVHWSLSYTSNTSFAEDFTLSRSILTLPVDQRLDNSSLEYLAKHLRIFLAHP